MPQKGDWACAAVRQLDLRHACNVPCRQGSRKRGRDANRPQYMAELVQSHMQNLTMSSLDATLSTRQKEDSAKKYATAHIRAHETGEPQLNAGSQVMDLQVRIHCC